MIEKKKPAIRFAVFVDDWEQHKLVDSISECTERTSDFEKFPLYSLTIEKGVTEKTERYERSFLVTKDIDLFKIVSPGCFVTNPMNLRFGAIGYNKTAHRISVSGYYDVFSIDNGECSEFWNSYLKTNRVIKKYDDVATGSLIEKRRVHFSELKKIILLGPSDLSEKQQIGTFFKNLDKLITFHQRKQDKLQNLKKSMLEKMFPKDAADVPEIRFKGFTGTWKIYRFEELYRKICYKNDLTYGKNDIISVANMYFKPDSYVTEKSYLLTYNIFELGDIAFEGNKSKNFSHGRFVENTIGNGIVSHVFDVFRPIMPQYDLMYWKYAINNENLMGRILVRCTKASTMMTNLVAHDFLKECLLVPTYEEQKAIGAFLSNLDNLIATYQQELEKLQNLKKAFMEKMFV